ncbi:hypothetical protein CFN78_06895 [Amycolatopsis antarctica]|uniref:Uncharacterized protein n=1 Tax=Amycolatopsis antarctica TaxID=1854586 RepID=A0A263D7L7_9PSEU|nr:hypothetical protein [Amycolatopsis antarctica]OZM74008.1 hypothetical protein CFN78_06895 [Amycolatopsis antarctica]
MTARLRVPSTRGWRVTVGRVADWWDTTGRGDAAVIALVLIPALLAFIGGWVLPTAIAPELYALPAPNLLVLRLIAAIPATLIALGATLLTIGQHR